MRERASTFWTSLKDLWSQFHFLQPDLLGPESTFVKLFVNPIKQGNERIETKLQHLITPFILRRSKEEVAKKGMGNSGVNYTKNMTGSPKYVIYTGRL